MPTEQVCMTRFAVVVVFSSNTHVYEPKQTILLVLVLRDEVGGFKTV